MNKKAQEFNLTVIIVIVLLVLALIFIIYSFLTNSSWSNNILSAFRSTNVASESQACAISCSSNQYEDYCCRIRDVTLKNLTTNKNYIQKMICTQNDEIKTPDCQLVCNDYIETHCPDWEDTVNPV